MTPTEQRIQEFCPGGRGAPSLEGMRSQTVEYQYLPCPVCGSAAAFLQSCRDADLYRCSGCDHCFSDPGSVRRVEEYGPEYYEKNWFQHEHSELFANIGRIIADFNADASVLDVGCGNGTFLKYLHRTYPTFTLTGIDLSSHQLPGDIRFIRGDILSTELQGGFDVVVSFAVIEHLYDVRTFAARLRRLCSPGGLVITMTLNDRSVLYTCSRVLHRFGIRGPCDQLYSGHHVNHFNTNSLRVLMERAGFSPASLLLHDIPLAAVDIIGASPISTFVQRCGVWGLFKAGTLTHRTYLQTLVCSNPVRT